MSLFDEFKRFKAGKKIIFLSRRNERLFNKLDIPDDQLLEISEWDRKNDIIMAIGMFLMFLLGSIYGSGY